MHEIVLGLYAFLNAGQPSVALRITPPARDPAEQEQFIVKLLIAVDQAYIRQFEDIRVDTDIAFAVIMRFGSRSLHYYLCGTVQL